MSSKKMIPSIFFKNNVTYEVTINPSDSMQHFAAYQTRLSKFVKGMGAITECIASVSEYDLYLEVSEPQKLNKTTSQPRLHYHGLIRFTDVATFLIYKYYMFGRMADVQFNEYRPTYWIDYITKQKDLMKDLCSRKGVRYHLYNSSNIATCNNDNLTRSVKSLTS